MIRNLSRNASRLGFLTGALLCALPSLVHCEILRVPGLMERGLSDAEKRNLKTVKSALLETRIGRELLAETEDVQEKVRPIEDWRFVVYISSPEPKLVFSAKALQVPGSWNFELALIRILSKAALGLPVDIAEINFYARINRAAFALQYAAKNTNFSRELLSKTKKIEGRWADIEDGGVRPQEEMGRAALDLVSIAQDPYFLYSRKNATPFRSEIEDFIRRYGPNFSGAKAQADGRYILIGKKLYPGSFLRDAQEIIRWGGLKRLKETRFPRAQDLRDLRDHARAFLQK